MFFRSRRLRAFLLVLVALTTGTATAAEIRMRGGVVYSNVTVLHRDASTIEIRTPHGNVTLPLAMVAQIDGIRIPPMAFPGMATPPGTALETVPATPATPPPALPKVAPSVRPTPKFVDAPPTSGASPKTPPTPHVVVPAVRLAPTPWWLGWPLYGLVGFVLFWMITVVSVWRDLRRRQVRSRGWLYVSILVPVLGYLAYRVARRMGRWGERNRPADESPRKFELLDENHQPILIQVSDISSGIENASGVLKDALLDRASDVHIEPNASEYRVRFRVDGVMQPRMKFSLEEGVRLVSAIKSLSQIDITERRKAQDGRFGARYGGREVDFRVATTPSVTGEKLVLRILDHKSGIRGLNDLGMSRAMMDQFGKVINSRSGMIISAGPTGAGKTSTLYAALAQIDALRLNVVTIEDPVEYQLKGATQIPVNVRTGVTFESGLRSILRQDPDVILVGEMRDLEAAQIALRSALTGHLVFSSLHARDAIGTIARLEEIGIERHLVATSLFVVMAQRLVRILCPHCRQPYQSTGDELSSIGVALPAGKTIHRAGGCRQCEGSGYVGRTGIFEMVIFDEELRQAVNAGMNADDFTVLARTKGYRSYREDAAEKVLAGITTADEVLQAV